MTKIGKFVFGALLISFFATVSAQCIPMNGAGPPRLWDGERGCYVPQGTPSLQQQQFGGIFQQQQMQQQQMQQMLAQQAIRVPMGQQAPNGYCSWGGRTENIAVAGILGAIVGVIAGDNRESARKGAALGMVAGMFVPCESLQQQQVVMQQQPQQFTGQQWQIQHQGNSNPCAQVPGTIQGVLNLSGHPKNGQAVCAKPGDPNISRWL